MEGIEVGEGEGMMVGEGVGDSEGNGDGNGLGEPDGIGEGIWVGGGVGTILGNKDIVGEAEGISRKSPETVQNSNSEELVPLKKPMEEFAMFTSIADNVHVIEMPPGEPPFLIEII